VLAGCGSDKKKTNPLSPGGGGVGGTSTTFTGTFMSGTESGKLTITIGTTSPANAVLGQIAPATAESAKRTAPMPAKIFGLATVVRVPASARRLRARPRSRRSMPVTHRAVESPTIADAWHTRERPLLIVDT